MKPDYKDYYHLEKYIRGQVFNNFHERGSIGATDFFCIIIWKANRAKSKIANKLRKVEPDLELCCNQLTRKLFDAKSAKEKLYVLIKEYDFKLPMGSAILSILYPLDFSVYDYRVCEALNSFSSLYHLTSFEKTWTGYNNYIQAVKDCTDPSLNLIEKDQYLWGKSFYNQLQLDIQSNFKLS